MKVVEVVDFLRGPSPRLMFDTNVIFSSNPRTDPFTALCTNVKLLNERRPAAQRIHMAISSVVLVEKLQDLRVQCIQQEKGFNPALIETFLDNQSLAVLPFARPEAASSAAHIATAHPSSDAWHAFKRRRCLACLGLPQDHDAPGKGSSCGANIDWLVAGHTQHDEALLVTHDGGPEFVSIARKATLGAVVEAVTTLLAQPAEADP